MRRILLDELRQVQQFAAEDLVFLNGSIFNKKTQVNKCSRRRSAFLGADRGRYELIPSSQTEGLCTLSTQTIFREASELVCEASWATSYLEGMYI